MGETLGVDVERFSTRAIRPSTIRQETSSAHEGVTTFIDAKHAIAQNKIVIIDD